MEEINYVKIVLEGYLNRSSRDILKDYFIRQWNKAKVDHYSISEFFNGLILFIEAMDHDMKMSNARFIKGDVQSWVHLPRVTNNLYHGNLSPDEVDYIRFHLISAYKEIVAQKNSKVEQGLNDEGNIKVSCKHFALTYYFEVMAKKGAFHRTKSTVLKDSKNTKWTGDSNTFYKAWLKILATVNLETSDILINNYSEDWREIVLKLTNFPKEVEEYLQSKQL
ncbi:hypothetical protein [Chryseobacterium sp. A321]